MHFKINSYVFSEEIGANAKKIRLVDSHWQLRSAKSASITSLAIHASGDVWVRACNVWLPRCPSYSMDVVCILANKGFPNLAIVTKFSPLPEQNDDLRFYLSDRGKSVNGGGRRERALVNFLKESFADEETCGDRHRIEHTGQWLDQRVAILADKPLCSDELDEQLSSLLCQ